MPSTTAQRPSGRIEHAAHGRIRVRIAKPDRHPEQMEKVRAHVADLDEVHDVDVNYRTGSVLIHSSDADRVRQALQSVLDLVPIERENQTQVNALVAAVKLGDDRLKAASRGRVSLRWVVPGAFFAIGVRQLMKTGFTVGTVPWYVLLYYGADAFIKLYPEHAPATKQGVRSEPL